MEFEVGNSVICTTPLKMLPDGEVGIILSMHPPNCNYPQGWVSMVYPQFSPVADGKGGYIFSKFVYARSAGLDTLIQANNSE